MAGVDANYDLKDIMCKICNDAYTNARELSCGHNFCLHCLQNKRPEKCPECEEENVPEVDQLKDLKINSEKNRLVGLEMAARVKNSYYNRIKQQAEDDFANIKNSGENEKHEEVVCSHCDKKDFAGVRYICGHCPSYNLCEDCEEKPKEHKHEKTHIFIKLKRPATKPLPEGPLLTELALKMGEAMDFDRSEHMVIEKVEATTYRKLSSVTCDRCPTSTGEIKGVRYNCGTCKNYDLCAACEKRSDIIHHPSHVFLKVTHPVNKVIEGVYDEPALKCDFY